MLDATLSFKWAYTQVDSNSTDRMIVYISNDCGDQWIIKSGLEGDLLASAPAQDTEFVPTDTSEWRTMEVAISNSFMTENFRFKIGFISGGGNNLYVDDVNLYGNFSPTPILVAPLDAATAPANNTMLDWKAVFAAEGYTFQLDTTASFNSPFKRTASTTAIDNTSNNADTEYEMPFLPDLWTYYWRVRALQGGIGQAWSETWTFTTQQSVSTGATLAANTGLHLFPNPTDGVVTLAFNSPAGQQAQIRLLDLTGKSVRSFGVQQLAAGQNTMQLQLNELPTGIYLLQVQLENKTMMERLVVR